MHNSIAIVPADYSSVQRKNISPTGTVPSVACTLRKLWYCTHSMQRHSCSLPLCSCRYCSCSSSHRRRSKTLLTKGRSAKCRESSKRWARKCTQRLFLRWTCTACALVWTLSSLFWQNVATNVYHPRLRRGSCSVRVAGRQPLSANRYRSCT